MGGYPRHYVAHRLAAHEPRPSIDGRLDDNAWAGAQWTAHPFVDITEFADASLNQVQDALQARAKIRWDGSYLYLAAELRGPFLFAKDGPSHNKVAPYHDDDFEVFIGPSGTTQYYKEFEVSVRNSTYDVLWGVPDGDGRQCNSGEGADYLPTCVNTSYPGYKGNWTMLDVDSPGLEGGGLVVATHYDLSSYATFATPYTTWSVEIAFPLRSGARHGGLLDAGDETSADDLDPAAHDQVYWFFDLARAVHPRRFNMSASGDNHTYCPLGCDPSLVSAFPHLSPPSVDECTEVIERYPTLLGVRSYSCYWEYVYQSLGSDAYMHRPLRWAILQFAPPQQTAEEGSGPLDPLCRMIEWPGRHLAANLLYAQDAAHKSYGRYLTTVPALLESCAKAQEQSNFVRPTGALKSPPRFRRPPTVPKCDVDVLRTLAHAPTNFRLGLSVVPNASRLTADCPMRPCFKAEINVTTPFEGYKYTVRIDSNSRLRVIHSLPRGKRPCLSSPMFASSDAKT